MHGDLFGAESAFAGFQLDPQTSAAIDDENVGHACAKARAFEDRAAQPAAAAVPNCREECRRSQNAR